MFVSKSYVEELKQQVQDANNRAMLADTRLSDAKSGAKVLEVNLDHLRLRVNQLEKERAQLTHAILGVRIAVPEFENVPPQQVADAFAEMPSFSDMGDEEARVQGIGHDDMGNVAYGKPLHKEE